MAKRGGYGIAEWYGQDITLMTVDQRKETAIDALGHWQLGKTTKVCPFSLRGAICNKKGGTCSIRPYGEAAGVIEPALPVVTACPTRFLEGGTLLRWVATTMLGTSRVLAIKETPFMKRAGANVVDGENAKAGRIDWLLVDNATAPRRLAALETQSLYFSGGNMGQDFINYQLAQGFVLPPAGRRPDYRSGGPKRLSPQLSVKVPLLRAWGIKMAVMVDEFFFGEMATLPEVAGSNDADRLSTAEIVWFVAKYDGPHLVPSRVIYSGLAESVRSLEAAVPMSNSDFLAKVDADIAAPGNMGKKVFSLS